MVLSVKEGLEKDMNSPYDPTMDYKKHKDLAGNPMQMAARILSLEKLIKNIDIFNAPNRRDGFVEQLKALVVDSDQDAEKAHQKADDLLLEYINDGEISELFGKMTKWYG